VPTASEATAVWRYGN